MKFKRLKLKIFISFAADFKMLKWRNW